MSDKQLKPIKAELEISTQSVAGYGKVKKATEVVIRFDNKVVATKTLGGEYNKTQALQEFKRNQAKWECKPESIELLKQLRLI